MSPAKRRPASSLSPSELKRHHALTSRLLEGLEGVIRGKRQVLERLLCGLLASGHVLIEDVPGLGKTTLAKAMARLIGRDRGSEPARFRRIQFTPDLLPYDITGVDIFDPERRRFVFSPGPVFANIVLADEINRTTPKVQSALLEVMAEGQVTAGNRTYPMDPLFFVIATQNPVEHEGTYPLPLAQLDRFLLKLRIGYPEEEVEVGIVKDDPALTVLSGLKPLCSRKELLELRAASSRIHCDERLIRAAVGTCAATRRHGGVEIGCSPRASLMLIKAARACALIGGRGYCLEQDLVDLAPQVCAHRLRLKDLKIDAEALVREIILDEVAKIRR